MTRTLVAKPLGLFLRGGSYSLRVMIPADLRAAYGGRTKIVESLGTSKRAEADRLAAKRRSELLAFFDQQRREANPVAIAAVAPELAAVIVQRVRSTVLRVDDAMRDFPEAALGLLAREGDPEGLVAMDALPLPLTMDGRTPGQLAALARHNTQRLQEAAHALASRDFADAAVWADMEAKALGLAIDWTSPAVRPLLQQCLVARRQAFADVKARDAGEVVATPTAEDIAARVHVKTADTGHTPREAFESWRDADPDRPAKTVDAFDAAMRRLEAQFPERTLESLTRADGVAFEASLKRWADEHKKSRTTAANILTKVKTVLNHAQDIEWIPRNPLEGRSIERAKSTRLAFSDADLTRLFAAPLFTRYALPEAAQAGKDAAYWLPLLGLFTGARISELAQLWTDDLAETAAAGWVVAFRANKDRGQSIKSRSGVRNVPLHPELVRLGFLDYLRAVGRGRPGPLFPGARRSVANGAGGEVSKWFGKFKTAAGFGPNKTFHSFRHTLETRLQAMCAAGSHIDALVGHAGNGEGQRTYTHLEAEHLRPTLERLTFPAVTALPRVYRTPARKPNT